VGAGGWFSGAPAVRQRLNGESGSEPFDHR